MESCEGCGLVVEGGTAGCQLLFDELRGGQLVASTYQLQRLTVDTYCMGPGPAPSHHSPQALGDVVRCDGPEEFSNMWAVSSKHPERYCVSAKSLAAHLTGLCWALEYSGHLSGLKALQRWLDGRARIDKPELPAFRGALTVADVIGATNPEERAAAIGRWARTTWEAYSDLQALARRWVEEAL
jgi:hypothetical protein